jgi:hypothetical protein
MRIKRVLATGGLSAVLIGGAAGVAVATTGHPASVARPAAAVQHHQAAGPSEIKETDPTDPGNEVTSPETDAPGGHQDPAGQNVDHQFNGVE